MMTQDSIYDENGDEINRLPEINDFMAGLKKREERAQFKNPKEDPFTEAAKKLRASLGIKSSGDVEQPIRFIKRKKYPTIKKINKHMTRRYPFMFCLSARRDILS